MARISTYPIISTPAVDDLLIGTDVNDLNITKNFTIGEIGDLIGQDYVPYVGATGNVNLGSFNITAGGFIVGGGTAGQFLKADGTLDSTVYTPQTRTLTINGTTYNLSANRSWDLNTIDTLTTTGTSGAATYIGKVLNIPVYQAQGAYITQLSGEATAVGPGNATVTLSNSAVISKILTGLNVTGGTVVSTDSILQAFGKVQNQINGLTTGVTYQGVWNAATNVPFLQSSVGTKGYYYVVDVAGNTNLNGITDWKVGDWAIYNGTTWDKVDNTDAVVSVNGYVGAVVLTSSDVGAVPTTRTITINGVGYNLSADRSWTVGDVRTDGSYANPSWITSLSWSKITGTPTTLAGYGITDGALNTRTLTINGTTYDLTANRTWSVGTVTSVGTSGPLTGGTITGSGTIGITQSGSTTDGYLSSTDWNAFNSKQEVISVNAPLTFAAGVIGITQSSSTVNGYLSSTDWTTFNSKVSGSGTANTLPMWGSASSLVNSPLSYAADTFNFQYNSATGGTVNFTNIGLTAYTYSIQMNNFGSPRSTVHSYTDGLVIQSIGGTQVSRMFANGNLILGTGTVDNGYKLEITGNLYVNTIANATVDTDRFIVSDGGVIKYRTGSEILADIGAVSSVGLTMPSAFTVSNSPITSSGTIGVTAAGTAAQYIRGDGTLADFPSGGGGGGSSVSYYLNGSVNQGTFVGNTYYEMNKTPIFGAGTNFSVSSDGYIAQFITDAGDPNSLLIPAGNWNFETYFNASSSGGTPSFYIELYKYDGTTFTLIASNSANPEFIAFGTIVNPYFSALAVPETILAITDRLAVRIYVVTSGKTITLHTENSNLCQVITTFSRGLTALNGLTEQVQYFQVGASGTDFNIASATATHTFNLPTASAVNRGALSSADWSMFNAKMPAITFNSPLFIASGGDVGITQAGASSNGFLSSTDWTTFNSKQNALTNPVTGTGTTNYLPKFTGASTIGNSIVAESGNSIGIGTAAPQTYTNYSVLEINNTTGGVIRVKNTAATGLFELATNVNETYIKNVSNTPIWFGTNNIERLRLDAEGNLGLGVTPSAWSLSGLSVLQIRNAGFFGYLNETGITQNAYFNSGWKYIATGNATEYLQVSGEHRFFTAPSGTAGNAISFTQAMTLTSGGNLLVGGTTDLGKVTAINDNNDPNSGQLVIAGLTSTLKRVSLGYNTTSNYGFISVYTALSGYNPLALQPLGGNLLVGTTTDNGARLQVEGTATISNTTSGSANNVLVVRNGASTVVNTEARLFLSTVAGDNRGAYISSIITSASNDNALILATNSAGASPTERMRITSSGNVGIGTTSPDSQLTLNGSSNSRLNMRAGDTRYGTLYADNGVFAVASITAIPLVFGTNDVEAMRITSGRNVLIGTTTDNGARLQVSGNATITGSTNQQLVLDFTTASGGFTWQSFRINGTNRYRIFGNTDNSFTLYSDILASNVFSIASTGAATFSSSVTANGTATFLGQFGNGSVVNEKIIQFTRASANTNIVNIQGINAGVGASDIALQALGGNVGIGTTEISSRLHVSGTMRNVLNSGAGGQTLIAAILGVSNGYLINVDTSNNITHTWHTGANATSMHIAAGGNVGIGTTNPEQRLHVEGNIQIGNQDSLTWAYDNGSFYNYITNIYNATDGLTYRSGVWTGSTSIICHSFETYVGGWSKRLVIKQSGEIGIGTANPARLLHLEGPTIAYGQIRLLNTSLSGEASIHLGRTNQGEEQRWTIGQGLAGIGDSFGLYTGGSNRVMVTTGGNVLIGTTTDAGYTLNVAGNAQFVRSGTSTAMVVGLSGVTGSVIRFSYNGGFVGSISTDGSNTAYNTSSDYRLKQDIKDFNGLDLLSRIKTYDFEWKSDKTRSYGVLAHELQEVINYAVTGSKDAEEMQGVDYSKIVPILIKAIQELNEKIK